MLNISFAQACLKTAVKVSNVVNGPLVIQMFKGGLTFCRKDNFGVNLRYTWARCQNHVALSREFIENMT